PEQFCVGATFFTSPEIKLKVSAYSANKNLIRFESYEDIEKAKSLTNAILYTSAEATKVNCSLGEGEHFWFDIEGCAIFEENILLGTVVEIERIGAQDYLHVKSEESFLKKGAASHFLIPYADHFICNVDILNKRIETVHARDLLESL
ncbi:MAG: 16S rRNA processing protein RimM, partial [Campylobacteraceae bacterium]|nr:16S rRNA processing protein RimM [Campylobacteraceae bacterium]